MIKIIVGISCLYTGIDLACKERTELGEAEG